MIQKIGNFLPGGPSGRPPNFNYAEVISVALRSEVGSDPQSVQIIANWTGATERAVNNWLNGVTGPSGFYLVRLLRKSDAVLEIILSLAARVEMLELFYESRPNRSNRPHERTGGSMQRGSRNAAVDDPDRDPDDPKIDPDIGDALATRQLWFLQELRRKREPAAEDIAQFFGVSLKTAKRDIASLKQSGLIGYVGSRRRGRYVALPGDSPP